MMTPRLRYALSLVLCSALLAVACPTFAQPEVPEPEEPAKVDLPITRAVLFASGVGYFEHAGSVEGEAAMTITFAADQINDVLKSLVLRDLGGGSVTSVSYPSKEPLSKALKSFSVDLSGDPSLANLLKQLRGSRITVMAPEAMTGEILTVEQHEKIVEDPDAKVVEHHLVLMTDTGIRRVALSSVSRFELEDTKLRQELGKALALLASARDQERKAMRIQFQGEGRRQVRIGYLVEAPVWKTSYRLDLSDLTQGNSGGEEDGEKALLQGWALVENVSDHDWQGVNLSLVSGQPISFVMDLYTPLYAPRPVVEPQLYRSLRPKVYEEGVEQERRKAKTRRQRSELHEAAAAFAGRARAEAAPQAAADMATAPSGEVSLGQTAQSVASAGDLGELFQYTIKHPVALSRRQAAMIPIINQPIAAEKVSIYNQRTLAKHPLNGVRITNDTELKMLAGPITVFDRGAYAGDARIGHLAPNEQRLLSYAVDLPVSVDPYQQSSTDITAAQIVRGVLQLRRLRRYEQRYAIENNADEPRSLILEHPFNASRQLVEPSEPMEKTAQLYRFRVDVDAQSSTTFRVVEEQTFTESISLLNRPASVLQQYVSTGSISQKVRDALSAAVELKNEISRLQEQIRQKRQAIQDITDEQERIRNNLRSVGQSSTLGRRYLSKLSQQEDEIEKLQGQVEELQQKLNSRQDQLAEYLSKLNVGR